MKSGFYLIIIIVLLITIGFLIYEEKKQSAPDLSEENAKINFVPSLTPTEKVKGPGSSGMKTFVFKSFHGVDFDEGIFEFQYPAYWYNEGQYFSPAPIKFYDLVSVGAPVYFDLVSTDLFETSDIKYQITTSKRQTPDSTVKIDGKTFRRYNLIDYGSYGGESAGRVIIYIGPKISFGGSEYYLVFHWEENPLTLDVPGNRPEIFEKIVESVKFR